MSRYTGPIYKRSRRIGFSISETGKELAKKPYPPGQHGRDKKRKPSSFGIQLTEKQKIRFMYGLNEKQLRKTFNQSGKMQGRHGENFLKLLESRLDNVIFRMGLANTRKGARQLVNHGHILVNNKKVNIPSYQTQPGSIISVKDNSKELLTIKQSLEQTNNTVEYVSFDKNKLEGIFIRYPERSELNTDINELLVVEYYSR